nr:AAA family ATPase [Neorhizobium tomejilense]
MEEHRGYIRSELRTFPSGDLVLAMEVESRAGMVPLTVVGPFDKLARPGDWFVMRGNLKPNTYNGVTTQQFVTKDIMPDLPRTAAGALALLDKTFNPKDHGIDVTARQKFVERHGDKAAFKIEKDPELLLEMTIDPKRFGPEIRNTWSRRLSGLQPIRIMEAAGAKPDVVAAVVKKYKYETLDIVQKNPFELMSVKGVDFKLADKFAERVGIAKSDPRRVSAALTDVVKQSLSDGNTYIPLAGIKAALTPYEVEWEAFKDLAASVSDRTKAEKYGVTIFNSKMGKVAQRYETYRSERDIAVAVSDLVMRGRKLDHARIDDVARKVLAQEKYSFLSEEQRAAVFNSSRESIAILTGGPGTGKSTVSDAIAEIAEQTISGPLYLVAPTGKAARRLAETTEREANTVHKLLGAMGDTGHYKFNKDNRLEKGCFVLVDESSMLDTNLTKALLDTLPEDGRILFVGDKDQLPSVDAGYVIGDMLNARAGNGNTVPSSELTEVFRSKGANNMIATYAKEIKEGRFDVSKVNTSGLDIGVVFFEMRKESISLQTEHIFCNLARQKLDLDPMRDVMVLCPMRKGRGGTHEINTRLQSKWNPQGQRIEGWTRPGDMDREEPTPRVGDRVMLTKNDDKLGIRNGDVGTIVGVSEVWQNKRKVMPLVDILLESGDKVHIPVSQAPYCTIVAYAITGHKSQGSQYQCVIMPVSPDHMSMMERTLLYTEWTRAKRLVIMVGDKDTFTAGIENTASSKRMTLLKSHIEDELEKLPVSPRRTPVPPKTTASGAAAQRLPDRTASAQPAFLKRLGAIDSMPSQHSALPQAVEDRAPPFAGVHSPFRMPSRG